MIELMMAAVLPLTVPHVPFAGGGPKGDAAKLNEIVAGVDFRSENDFRVAVYDEGRNLLVNPSFESGMRYWKDVPTMGDPESWLSTEYARSGRYSLKVPAPQFPPHCWKTVGTVLKPNTWYTVSVYARSPFGEKLDPKKSYGAASFRGNGGYEAFLKECRLFPVGDGTPDARGWVRLAGRFQTKDITHEATGWCTGTGGFHYDDYQLEEGTNLTEYAGNPYGLDLDTDADGPDRLLVDVQREDRPLSLVLRGPAGAKGRLKVRHHDLLERSVFAKDFDWEIPAAGALKLPLGLIGDYPKGINGFEVRVEPAGGRVYEDYLRFAYFKYQNGKARNRRLQTVSSNMPSLWHMRFWRIDRLRKFGFGGFSITGAPWWGQKAYDFHYSNEDRGLLESLGLEDYWGTLLTFAGDRRTPEGYGYRERLNNKPFLWEGKNPMTLEANPPEFLKWVEDNVAEEVANNPRQLFWTLHAEPQGHWKTLLSGNSREHAKLIMAIYRGVKRGNPRATYQPYGAYNMEQRGRGWFAEMMAILHEMDPKADFPVIDIHSYRAFPESPDIEKDFLALLDCVGKAGYPDVKVKIGEGSYYCPMMRRSLNMMPWTGVHEHDGYNGIVIPGYDLGAGEKIGTALCLRESLIYLKHEKRVHSACNWTPSWIDSLNPVGWPIMHASLMEMLGDATFDTEVRFSAKSRSYVFDDQHGSAVAAVWRVDELFDRGTSPATTLRLGDVEGLEIYDMYANKVKVKGAIERSEIAEGLREQRMEIPFSGYPVFLKVPKAQRQALVDALNAATVDADREVLPVECGIEIRDERTADVKMENPLTRPVAFTVKAGDRTEQVTLKPREAKDLTVALAKPIAFDRFETVKLPVAFTLADGRVFDRAFETDAIAVTHVDGKPDWTKVPSAPFEHCYSMHQLNEQPTYPKSADDCSIRSQLAWNEKALYLRFMVKDDALVPSEDFESKWAWFKRYGFDSFQLFFDAFGNANGNFRRGIVGHDFDDFSYELCPIPEGKPEFPTRCAVYRRFAPDHQHTGGAIVGFKHMTVETNVVASLTREGGKSVYEVEFPLHYLMPMKLVSAADRVAAKGDGAPALGVEFFDRDEKDVFPKFKMTNVRGERFDNPQGSGNPHLYPQLIFVKDGAGAANVGVHKHDGRFSGSTGD